MSEKEVTISQEEISMIVNGDSNNKQGSNESKREKFIRTIKTEKQKSGYKVTLTKDEREYLYGKQEDEPEK